MKKSTLSISLGQHTDQGKKQLNQDFHGGYTPQDDLLAAKGIAVAIADGISSSDVSHIASESIVTSFLEDYYATQDTLSVKTSVERVLNATNTWLYAQTRQNRYEDNNQGYVCTFTGMVFKGTTGHIFHVGDSRVYRVNAAGTEQLTEDHRVRVSSSKSYLSRAVGVSHRLDLDYCQSPLAPGDIYLLATDGVYEFAHIPSFAEQLLQPDSDISAMAQQIVAAALANGSDDNLTIQIVRIDALPELESSEIVRQLDTLPCPPSLAPGMSLDGLDILREIKIGSRSHIFLATNSADGSNVVLKVPSTSMRNDRAYLERFLVEDWVSRRINSEHIVKPCTSPAPRSAIYVATAHINGQSLAQWMRDNPRPDLTTFRKFIKQIARGLQAIHRQEIIHQDLKPDNIIIDKNGTLKIIDFGAARVAGLDEGRYCVDQINLLGAAQYAAPEYFLGERGSSRSDLFSLGVIAYQLLSGNLPYGDVIPKIHTAKAMGRIQYQSLKHINPAIPDWIDAAIHRAVHPDPTQRYAELSEFIHDLYHPNSAYNSAKPIPLIQRNPLRFWQISTAMLLVAVILLSLKLGRG